MVQEEETLPEQTLEGPWQQREAKAARVKQQVNSGSRAWGYCNLAYFNPICCSLYFIYISQLPLFGDKTPKSYFSY